MIMFVPECHKIFPYNKLLKKIPRETLICGIYKGYHFEEGVICTLIHGGVGWNLFINEDIDRAILIEVLSYILLNKKAVSFLLKHAFEYEIHLKVKK